LTNFIFNFYFLGGFMEGDKIVFVAHLAKHSKRQLAILIPANIKPILEEHYRKRTKFKVTLEPLKS